MRKLILALGLLFLGACQAVPPPTIQVKPVVEKVLVPIPCINAGDLLPEPPHVASQLNGMAGHDLLIVDQSALDLRAWGEDTYGKLTRCSVAQDGKR